MLELKNIVKDYKAGDMVVHALKGITLNFRDNEFVSILGASGCGKTTLLNVIGGLDHYTSGDLMIKGKSTKDFKDRDWDAYRNHSIGFVFQSYNLIPHLSVIKNVELALTLSGIKAKERSERAKQALIRVGLEKEIHKRPNQLSGGQMQRVAIARALINDPEILLADEPTGALDSETSVQIMDLIQEISKERLVIMVTHNPELAKVYSTRIIELKDGLVISDSKPYKPRKKKEDAAIANKEQVEIEAKPTKQKKVKKEKSTKTSMSFFTALGLSFKNLLSKKGRTIMIALAGSIGIIGIALVMAISNGFQIYIDKMQADTLSSYPLTIAEDSLDLTSMMSVMEEENQNEKYPTVKKIIVNEIYTKLMEAMTKKSNITQEYIDTVIGGLDKSLYYDILMETGYDLTNTLYLENNGTYQKLASANSSSMFSTSSYSLSIANEDFIRSQYDVIDGRIAKEKNEIMLVVDEYNQLTDTTLMQLGIKKYGDNAKEYTFDDIKELNYVVLSNNDYYEFDSVNNKFTTITNQEVVGVNKVNLQIVGILRPNQYTQTGVFSNGIVYTQALYNYMMEQNVTSAIVEWCKANPTLDPMTGQVYEGVSTLELSTLQKNTIRSLGGNTVPNSIKIYAKDFNSKAEIKKQLDNYNNTVEEEQKVYYTDIMEIMTSTLSTMVNSISYVLIAFTSVSLVVSSIMIGIITYVSVIERTKEIGVLRSLGARKKDISRVFNAETFMIGLTAGIIGVGIAYLLTIPINLLLGFLLPEIGNLANLSIFSAIGLVVISFILTLISGLVPSRIASKKDPVVALRTE